MADNNSKTKLSHFEYEMIICIVNSGFADTVMAAAKDCGARGGTIIHAKGTANKDAEEFFHITIQPDKDIVLLIVSNEIKDRILHAVYNSAGLKTPGQGIAFSLPVNSAVGLKKEAPVLYAINAMEKESETENDSIREDV